MKAILSKSFFARPSPEVAHDLIGKYLLRKVGTTTVASMIIETEAYEGFDDLASHASKGETARTKVMFGEPGIFYVYLVYGMHEMLNVVTGAHGYPSAVLIRGVEMAVGPGRLTKLLEIDRTFNGLEALPKNQIWFEDRGIEIPAGKIKRTPRIGVDYAGPVWSKKKYRFVYSPKS